MLMGMDIGYSNLKLCFGNNENDLQVSTLPVGVIKDDRDDGFRKKGDPLIVLIDGVEYIAGLSPADISLDYQRVLHNDYPASLEYKALFYASLLKSGLDTIDLLVTGLPVDQFQNRKNREHLEHQLSGKHEIQKGRFVEVKKVAVIPQLMGGYMLETSENDDMYDSLTLVLDPGFFSVDWTVLQKGNILKGALGTSKKAVSAIFEEAKHIVLREHGCRITIDVIEKAVVSGKGYIRVFSEKLEIDPILEKASEITCSSMKKELLSMLRERNIYFSMVLLVGGGAKLYEKITRNMFPSSKIVIADDSVLSNARGFWLFARGLVDA